MQVKILTNALIYGDAVSLHCVLLKKYCQDLGIEAEIYAKEFDERLGEDARGPSPEHLLEGADPTDILFHQYFNDTDLISFVERFPGRRVLMYHNVTPPDFFDRDDPVWERCDRGLRLLRTLPALYDYAVGMSEFSRRDLEAMGFPRTGVFPLLIHADRLRAAEPKPQIVAMKDAARTTFLYLGRVSPNKKVDTLPAFLAAYRGHDAGARFVVVGDNEQHPEYTAKVEQAVKSAGLRLDSDFLLAGKLSDEEVRGWFEVADAYVSVSEHEGFCAPLIEAMAMGRPVFALDAGASGETLSNELTLVRKREPAEMAAQVYGVLSNPERRTAVLERQAARLEDFSDEAQRRRVSALVELTNARPVREPYEPTISVVINTYNRGSYLERALHALRNQTYRNFEVVVVNGPSTDDTEARLEKFKDQIRIARTDKRIICVSRNEGIEAARGELVAFLDDDAVPQATWLQELAPAFQDPKVGGVGGMVYRWRGHDYEFRNGVLDRLGLVDWYREEPGLEFDWSRGYLNTVSGNNCIFRRSALEEIGGFDEEIEYYHDEADIVIRIAAAGYRTVHRPRAIVYHEAAGGHNRSGKYSLNWFVIVKNTLYCALKNYPENGVPIDMTMPELKACEPAPEDRKLVRFEGTRKELAKLVTEEVERLRVKPLFKWWQRRELTFSQFLQMRRDCKRGIAEGRRKGMTQAPKLRRFTRHADGVLLYPAAEAKGLSVCLLTQTLPHESPGGVATYTVSLAHGLQACGCEVHVVSRGDRETSEQREGVWYHTAVPRETDYAKQWGGQYSTVARNLDYAYGVWRRVVEIDSRWALDIVESPAWDFEGFFLALDNRLPLAVRLHSPLFEVMKIQGWQHTADLDLCIGLEGSLLRHATAVYGSTKAILDLVLTHYRLKPDVTARIPLGIPVRPEDGASAGASRVTKILFVGRLEPRKGIDVFLAALPQVLMHSPEAVVEIAGRELERPGKVARWLDAHPEWRLRVRGHGEVSDAKLQELYAGCDVFVAPSIYESFGLIYLEAMRHGKPVIGSKAGGIPEVVADGETGMLVPPGDSRALSEAMLRLVKDAQLRASMGAAGRVRFEEKFTTEVMARNTLPFYQRVVEAWKSRERVVFDAEALAMERGDGVAVEWDASFGSMCLKSHRGKAETLCWGPYQGLEHGRYRAQFWLHLDGGEPKWVKEGWVCRLESFAMQTGVMGYREVSLSDLGSSRTAIMDLFFEVAGPDVAGVEYRVLASGALGVALRRIRVSRYE